MVGGDNDRARFLDEGYKSGFLRRRKRGRFLTGLPPPVLVLGREPVVVVVGDPPALVELDVAAVGQHCLETRTGPLHFRLAPPRAVP
jgi:hypothetical protein